MNRRTSPGWRRAEEEKRVKTPEKEETEEILLFHRTMARSGKAKKGLNGHLSRDAVHRSLAVNYGGQTHFPQSRLEDLPHLLLNAAQPSAKK